MFYDSAAFLSGYLVSFVKIIFQKITFCIFYAIMKIQKDYRRELGSSLPTIGGGGTMKKLAIASLVIQICMLLIAFIDLLFK